MIETPFGALVRAARTKADLTLAVLAERAQMDLQRVSLIERGKRAATPEQAERLSRILNLDPTRLRHATRAIINDDRELLTAARELLGGEPYFPVGDRPAEDRFRTAFARYRDLMHAMSDRIEKRPDADRVIKLAARIRYDSSDEVLNLTHYFDLGAQACLDAPNTRAPLPATVIDHAGRPAGHRPHPCLVLAHLAIYPQVTFGLATPQTVDLLVWDQTCWRRWEVDGAAHDALRDPYRERALPLLTQRFRTSDIERAARTRAPLFQT